jgi:hypothetical protein
MQLNKPLVTIIMTVYKRSDWFLTQLEGLKQQTIPHEIWVDYTIPEGGQQYDLQQVAPDCKFNTHPNQNLKYHGRFYYGLNAQTPYVFIIDDDILPGRDYLKNCISIIKEKGECLLTPYGVKINPKSQSYENVTRCGWHDIVHNRPYDYCKEVDMAGHSWFIKRETLKYVAYEQPYTYQTGEDLHFSYCVHKYGNIPIYATPHPSHKPEIWGCDPEYGMKIGNDNNASYKQNNFIKLRNDIVKHQIKNGWKLVRNK